MGDTNIVFGATGALGSNIVRRLAADGKPVVAAVRDVERAKRMLPPGVEIRAANALSGDGMEAACAGAGVIFDCVNVPYDQWCSVMPLVTGTILAAAGQEHARLVFPGNVYGYGRFRQIPAPETHPKKANTHKGRLRNELEEWLMEAHRDGNVRVVIPRMPDFYGPFVTNRLYGNMTFEAAIEGRPATWLANADVPHDFIFIEDAARACVRLGETDDAYGQEWHIPGAGPLTTRRFLQMAFEAAGTPFQLRVLSAAKVRFGALFSPLIREMAEILYLFQQPQVLDGGKFARAFPDFAFTPHEEAIQRTVEWFREAREAI